MTWVRMDDDFPMHRKVRPLSDGAFRLHVSALCWSAKHLTDGYIPEADLPLASDVRVPRRRVKELEQRGLWHRTERGWLVNDFLEYNDSAEEVKAKRERAAERQRRSRAGRGLASQGMSQRDSRRDKGVTDDVTTPVSHATPVPSRPDLLPTGVDTSPAGEDPDFAKFWSVYPRRVAKDAARKAWAKSVRRAGAADIIVGAERYRDDPNRSAQFTKHPATWLNGGCWSDEPAPPRLRAVGGYEPYHNPDPDEYERGFFDER